MGGKKRSSSGNADASTFWDDAKGWKPVEVGEDFLVGNEEYGFMGLEELDASSLGKQLLFFPVSLSNEKLCTTLS